MKDARWQRISRIYHDAVALAPAERVGFLLQTDRYNGRRSVAARNYLEIIGLM